MKGLPVNMNARVGSALFLVLTAILLSWRGVAIYSDPSEAIVNALDENRLLWALRVYAMSSRLYFGATEVIALIFLCKVFSSCAENMSKYRFVDNCGPGRFDCDSMSLDVV